jgi:hypothetical protein
LYIFRKEVDRLNYLTTEDGKAINPTNPLDTKDSTIGTLIGEVQASPTANTLLARLKSLEDKIDKITNGTTPAVTQLSGSILEYAWFTGAEQPIPADQTKFAWGYEFDETTGEISAYGWSGAAWVKVVI